MFVVCHAGAGLHGQKNIDAYRKVCRNACSIADTQSNAFDTVVDSIKVLEDHPLTNAGLRGSSLTAAGTVECDASIMTDLDEYGAVAAVSHVQNPIKLARKILENGRVMQKSGLIPPLMLSGSGAFEYARRNQISIIENSSELISEKTLQLFEKYSSLCGTIVASNDDLLHDTVGCVAFDGEMMVSGVSSGGIWLKQQGRVGEAAVYGAGCWSEKASSNKIHVGCSVSGTGEQIIRTSLAERLCRAVISHAQTGDCNLAECLKREMTVGFLQSPKLRMYGDSLWAGFVMLVSVMNDSDGSVELWYGHTTETMAIAYHSTSDNKQPKFILSRKPKDRQLTLAGIPLI